MNKEATKKKTKKNKKIKKEKFSSDYNRLINNLYNILGLNQSSGSLVGFGIYSSIPTSKEEDIIQKIISLKVAFAREDEGTKLEAENKRNLLEVIQMLTKDEARLLEAGKKLEQIKKDNCSCDCN